MKRRRLGLVYSYNDQWIGGTYYIHNLIQAFMNLPDSDWPEIVAFSNPKDFERLTIESPYPYLSYEEHKEIKLSQLQRLLNKVVIKLFGKPMFKHQYAGKLDALFMLGRSSYLESIPMDKRIYWIPDFQDKHYPQFFTSDGLEKKDKRSRWIAENAKHLILSSEAVMRDWVKYYPDHKCSVKVVHFAVTHPEFASLDIEELKRKFNLPSVYFFAPNQFWAHKNHIVVIKAAEILRNEGMEVCIAFSGKENDNRNPGYTESLKDYVAEKNLQDQVRFLGFLDRREQLQLMKHARAVIQPSKFEGWSTVIEDAMAMNQPIIASDLEVNNEQLGNWGEFFEQDNPKMLAELMRKNLQNQRTVEYPYQEKLKDFASSFISLLTTK